MSPDELRALWWATQDLHHYGAILRILMLTGQRPGEISRLRWSEIVLTTDGFWQIELPRERVKNRRPHVIPLSPLAYSQLPPARGPAYPNVFGRVRGGQWDGWAHGRANLKAKLRNTPPWRPHDLRRTFVTLCHERNLALPHIIEATVNHIGGTKAGVAGVYNRAAYLPQRRELMEVWSVELAKIVGVDPGIPQRGSSVRANSGQFPAQ